MDGCTVFGSHSAEPMVARDFGYAYEGPSRSPPSASRSGARGLSNFHFLPSIRTPSHHDRSRGDAQRVGVVENPQMAVEEGDDDPKALGIARPRVGRRVRQTVLLGDEASP